MKHFAMTACVLLLSCAALGARAADDMFTDFAGQPRTIESYAGGGKWLVVMVWAHDCHVCNQEAEGYARFHLAHKDTDATVLGLSIDGQAHKADAEAFIARHRLPFPNLIGEGPTSKLYYMMLTRSQFLGTPSILVFDPAGDLVAAQAGAVPAEVIEDFMARQASAGKAG